MDRSGLAGKSLTNFSLYLFKKILFFETALKFELCVSEENPNVSYYPEEDNVLGQHETSLNETNIEDIRDVTTFLLLPYNK